MQTLLHSVTPQPCSRAPPTHASARDSWTLMGKSGSVSCGDHCSFLLGPSAHKFLFVPSKILFPQSCVNFGMVGLNATSSKRAYAIPRSAAPRAPAPATVHCWPVPLQETLKHSSVSISVGSLGPGGQKVCLSPLSISSGYGVWFKTQCWPSYCFAGASPLPLDVGYSPQSHSSVAQLPLQRLLSFWASLPLDVAYLLAAAPALHSSPSK